MAQREASIGLGFRVEEDQLTQREANLGSCACVCACV